MCVLSGVGVCLYVGDGRVSVGVLECGCVVTVAVESVHVMALVMGVCVRVCVCTRACVWECVCVHTLTGSSCL